MFVLNQTENEATSPNIILWQILTLQNLISKYERKRSLLQQIKR